MKGQVEVRTSEKDKRQVKIRKIRAGDCEKSVRGRY